MKERGRVWGWAIALFLFGMVTTFWPMFDSGFGKVPGDLGDARFINYVLEHAYLWVQRDPQHLNLWNAPFFHPLPNTIAFSDTLFGVAPIYIGVRFLGAGPTLALQLWILICCGLNFAAMSIFARRCCGLGGMAAAVAAFIFTFGNARLTQLNHLQLLPQFYSIVALYGIVRLLDGSPLSPRRERGWIVVTGLSITAQLYSGFYFGWFLVVVLAGAGVWALLDRTLRNRAGGVIRRQWAALIVAAFLSGALLIPMIQHAQEATEVLQVTTYIEMKGWLPRWQSWLFPGAGNWLYGWTNAHRPFSALPVSERGEHAVGLGLVTTIAAIAGLAFARQRSGARLLILAALSVVIIATLQLGDFRLWKVVYDRVPGAVGIRTVARIGMLGLFVLGIGAGFAIDRLRTSGRSLLAIALVVVIIAEQRTSTTWWEKEQSTREIGTLAALIDPTCAAFFASPEGEFPPFPRNEWYRYQIDAMWASLQTGIPTVNGYTSRPPIGWEMIDPTIRGPEDEARLNAGLTAWEGIHPFDGPLCRIFYPKP